MRPGWAKGAKHRTSLRDEEFDATIGRVRDSGMGVPIHLQRPTATVMNNDPIPRPYTGHHDAPVHRALALVAIAIGTETSISRS